MTIDNFCFYLKNRIIQNSQTGGQWYSDTFPFSIPWRDPQERLQCPLPLWLRKLQQGSQQHQHHERDSHRFHSCFHFYQNVSTDMKRWSIQCMTSTVFTFLERQLFDKWLNGIGNFCSNETLLKLLLFFVISSDCNKISGLFHILSPLNQTNWRNSATLPVNNPNQDSGRQEAQISRVYR